jgi:outer membrane receptor protein involved in Fe transport
LGFQSQNIGDVRVTGIDLSASIGGKVRNSLITTIVGYSYNNPFSKTGEDTTTSSLSPMLKYRNKHSIKGDINVETRRITFGVNVIWRSAMENVDRLFCDERDETTVNPITYNSYLLFSSFILPGYWNYRIENAERQYINFDVRFGFKFSEKMRTSLVIKNLFNREFVGRPGDMYAPRRFEIVLSATF